MFGLSIKEQADKLYEQGFEDLLRCLTIKGIIDNDDLPRVIWSDAYMQGFFFGLAFHLRAIMVNRPPTEKPTENDAFVVNYLLENHLARDGGYEDFKESLGGLQSGNIQEGWSKDEYMLATNHAVNIAAIMHDKLAPQFHDEEEIIRAKDMAQQMFGSQQGASVAAVLPIIYLSDRMKKLTES